MLTPSELKSMYKQAVKKQPSTEDEESVCVLLQNDWVRILTVHDSETSQNWRIEVEVSLPSCSDPESGNDVRNFIETLIRHLNYLLQLDKKGLTLNVMLRDNLWTAYLELDDTPQDDMFRALIPPSL